MKIIFVISAMNGGGAERVLATLANCYVQQGDEVTILMVAGDESAYPLDEKVNILSIGQPSHGNPLVQVKRLSAMRKYFKRHKDAVIVSFGTEINLFSILSSLGLKNKVVVSERSNPKRCGYQRIRNIIYGFCKHFVFQTEEAKCCFPKKVQSNSVVIPNPIRAQLPDPLTMDIGEIDYKRVKKIAAVGRLNSAKNYGLLLKAFSGFLLKYPEWELHIFGKGELEQELKTQTDELKIKDKVVFEGFRNDVLETIKNYGMYVLSSDYEGISNSLMEAMAIGLPCISTDCPIGGSSLCIQDRENGRLIPVGDYVALQKAMEWIAQDAGRAEQMGQQAVKIRERFSEKKISELWRTFIEGK